MTMEGRFASLSQRTVTVFCDDFRYRGKLHIYRDLRVIDEMNKADRRFLPITQVEVLPLAEEAPIRVLDYAVIGKSGMDFVALDEVEPYKPVSVHPLEEKVAVFLAGYNLQGLLRRQEVLRPVDELNRPESLFFDMIDVTVYRNKGNQLTLQGTVPSVLVNKDRVGMVIPLAPRETPKVTAP